GAARPRRGPPPARRRRDRHPAAHRPRRARRVPLRRLRGRGHRRPQLRRPGGQPGRRRANLPRPPSLQLPDLGQARGAHGPLPAHRVPGADDLRRRRPDVAGRRPPRRRRTPAQRQPGAAAGRPPQARARAPGERTRPRRRVHPWSGTVIDEVKLKANGLRFRALAAGPARGEPVLLLHGFPEGAESWTAQLEALADAGHRAVAPDLRGYGGTDAPPDESDYAIEPLVADVLGLFDALGWERAHLAGHDWGSLVGWPCVALHRDRVITWTSLSVGHPLALTETARDPEQQQRSAYIRLL